MNRRPELVIEKDRLELVMNRRLEYRAQNLTDYTTGVHFLDHKGHFLTIFRF
jgi:hypothetical protein